MAKQLYDVTITREATYTVYGVSANTPEEAELIAAEEPVAENDPVCGDLLEIQAFPSETE